MANIDLEEYIKDLTPEQAEKVLACKTNEELIQLAAQEDMDIPLDALAGIAGRIASIKDFSGSIKDIADAIYTIKMPGIQCPDCGGPVFVRPVNIKYGNNKLINGYCKNCKKNIGRDVFRPLH